MNPTPAEMLNGSPRSHSARMPPMIESGTVEKTTSVLVTLLKAKKSSSRISISTTGMTTSSVRMAFWRFSN